VSIGLVTLILTHNNLSFFFILFIVIRNARTSTKDQGLNKRMPDHHPLIAMFRKTLKIIHGGESNAANNYIGNVSWVLYFIHNELVQMNTPPNHWADLVTADVSIYERFIEL